MALHVEKSVEVMFQHTESSGVVRREGQLGVGRDDAGRAIFGEVVRDEFTHRCYLLDESLDLQGMSQRGLALDTGQGPRSTGRVMIGAEDFSRALHHLPIPVATLAVGDEVEVDHGVSLPMRSVGTVLDRADDGSVLVRDPRPETGLSRQEGTTLPSEVWFDPDGRVDLERTDYVDGEVRQLSTRSLHDLVERRALDPVQARPLVNEPEPGLEPSYSDLPEGWGQLTDEDMDEMAAEMPEAQGELSEPELSDDPRVAAWREDLDRLRDHVDQWNPHNPEMVEKLQRFEEFMDTHSSMITSLEETEADGVPVSSIVSDDHLERMRKDMVSAMDLAGVPRRPVRTKPEPTVTTDSSQVLEDLRSRYEAPWTGSDVAHQGVGG